MNGALLLLAALAVGAAYVLGWRAGLAQARDELLAMVAARQARDDQYRDRR